MSINGVAENNWNVLAHGSGGQKAKSKALSGLHSLWSPLEEDPCLPLPASGDPGVPWFIAASTQSLSPSSHGLLLPFSSASIPTYPLLSWEAGLLNWLLAAGPRPVTVIWTNCMQSCSRKPSQHRQTHSTHINSLVGISRQVLLLSPYYRWAHGGWETLITCWPTQLVLVC